MIATKYAARQNIEASLKPGNIKVAAISQYLGRGIARHRAALAKIDIKNAEAVLIFAILICIIIWLHSEPHLLYSETKATAWVIISD